MKRSVLFDTETTGLDPAGGHRIIEIAALELRDGIWTREQRHWLLHPEREIPEDATRIHGFTLAHLESKPRFAEIADELLEFFGDDPLIAHNAPFDFAFLDAELSLLSRPRLDKARMVCTLVLAQSRFPGLPNSLDALCRRFAVDLSARTTHNALLDCKLLAEVYVELTGGRQRGLALLEAAESGPPVAAYTHAGPRTPRLIVPSETELAAHAAFLAKLKEPLWAAELSAA